MQFLKKLIPGRLLAAIRPFYHGLVARAASFYFGRPSGKMIVIGITGTAGKSTTIQMLSHILNRSGKKCGYITTIDFFDGSQNILNKHGLSMPGGWLLQKQLRQMLKNGCGYAIVECTSEGLAQNRHKGINFDVAAITNLSPAHIEAHGGFENYKQAKGKLFAALGKLPKKNNFSKKIIGVNLDDPSHEFFLKFQADRKFGVSFSGNESGVHESYAATKTGAGFTLGRTEFLVLLPGEFNAYNALLATACASELGISLSLSADALKTFTKIRGRMEEVENSKGFKIFVDYGCEPVSIAAALKAATALPHQKLIHVFGSAGGHRDIAKQFEFGKISASVADSIIITNDDVYDSNPEQIAGNIESGIKSYELWKGQFETILDRRAAIARALAIAQAGDLVLITGKGSEQFLVLSGNKRINWDDRSVVAQELDKIHNS